MKRLILVRHGKSAWNNDVPDKQRPLKKRAYKDAELVIKGLKKVFEKPVTLWSSSAVRALETAKIFKEELFIEDEKFNVKNELYTFESRSLINSIASCDDSVDQLMVFGHNPAMTQTVNTLGDQRFYNIPTTGLSIIDFESDSWRNLNNGKILLHLFPKDLR